MGYFGPLNVRKGGVATEYATGNKVLGKETEYPTIVPTMNVEELMYMTNRVIPDRKKIPASVDVKARKNARDRILQGKSPFRSNTE